MLRRAMRFHHTYKRFLRGTSFLTLVKTRSLCLIRGTIRGTKEGVTGRSILLVEDDVELCALMRDFFEPHGFKIEFAHDGVTGLDRAMHGAFDLIVLDVMLPVIDGFEVLRQTRKRSETPIIMLTARTRESDRVNGLNCGADDYLPKPFGPEELLARIRAVLRRAGKAAPRSEIVAVGNVRLDPRCRTAWRDHQPLALTAIQFDILEILMRSAGRVVSRDEIAAILHQRPSTPYERSLDVHISHLRKKIESENDILIQTVRGHGYLFAPRGGGAGSKEST
jgi:two-component system response regulator CpxR